MVLAYRRSRAWKRGFSGIAKGSVSQVSASKPSSAHWLRKCLMHAYANAEGQWTNDLSLSDEKLSGEKLQAL